MAGWLMLELTNSPFMVGLVAAIRTAGMGLGPFFGTVVDRFNRKHVLLVIRAGGSIITLIMLALHYTSLLEVWHIFIMVLLLGGIRALNFTANNAVAPDTVDKHNLTSAIGLLFVGLMSMTIIGPLVGGYLLEQIGIAACFIALAVAYLFACVSLFPIRLPSRKRITSRESVWKSLADGLGYIMNDKSILAALILAAVANIFVTPVVASLMPVFAREELNVGASGLGWLVAANGIGGLIGSVIVSSLGGFKYKGWLQIISLVLWPAFLGFFAIPRLLLVNMGFLVGVGIFQGMFFALNELVLLMWSSEEARGRVMGVRAFCIVMGLLGGILLGSGASFWGASTTIVVSAVSCIVTTVLVALWASQLRRRTI